MASDALATVVDMLRGGGPLAGRTIPELRAGLEAQSGAVAAVPGVAHESVDAGGVRAEWARPQARRGSGAIVYLHGGGYCIGSVRTHRLLVGGLATACGVPVLSVDYRLAPEHPFPAAVDDAVAAYRYLLGQDVPPARVAFAGDSAGGGLVVAALLALRAERLPMPAAGVCISPWLDLELTGESMRGRADADPLVRREMLATMAEAYLQGADPRTPTASPLYGELAGLPPLLLHVGTAEVLLDDARRFAARAERAGVDVTLEVWEDMIHVWHAFALLLPEGQQAIDRIGEFVGARLRGRDGGA